MEHRDKKAKDELEIHEEYFVNVTRSLLSSYKDVLEPAINNMKQHMKNLKRYEKAIEPDEEFLQDIERRKALEHLYLSAESKVCLPSLKRALLCVWNLVIELLCRILLVPMLSFNHFLTHIVSVQRSVHFLRATAKVSGAHVISDHPALRVGLVFCGRQSPEGHMLFRAFMNLSKFTTPKSLCLGFCVVPKVYLLKKLVKSQMMSLQPTKIKVVIICLDGQRIR